MATRFSKATTLAVLATALALGVAACGGDGESAPAEPPAPAAEPAAAEPPVSDAMEGEALEGEHMEGEDTESDSMEYEEPGHAEHDDVVEAPESMEVGLDIELDAVEGLNVRIDPTGFAFTPENVNGEHVSGEGHAHIYVDGEKVGRVYGEWYHLGALEPGAHEIRATLNANTHAEYARDGAPLDATASIDVPDEEEGHAHSPDPVEAPEGTSVALEVELDEAKGYNVRIIPTGFVFTPENVNGEHVPGEGHAHLYVDGEKVARTYGEWLYLDPLPDGQHVIRATLNANTHAEYAVDGDPVDAAVTLTSAGEIVESEPEHADADADGDEREHADGAAGDEGDSEPGPDPGTVITLVGGEPVDGVVKIEVKNGETAIFTVSSDTAGEVHVHGFDVTKSVGPAKDTRFKLETSFEGIFEIELHGPGGDTEIASLVIQP